MNTDTIKAAIQIDKYCTVHFKTFTTPKFGKLVTLQDHERLLNNGFVRFVSLSRLEQFNEATPQRKEGFTLLLKTDNIKHIFPTDKI